jgi:hypothetical protein
MNIPESQILPNNELHAIAQTLTADQAIHDWKPEPLVLHFAFLVPSDLWFLDVDLASLGYLLQLDIDNLNAACQTLRQRQMLLKGTPPAKPWRDLAGNTYPGYECFALQRGERVTYENKLNKLRRDAEQASIPNQPTTNEVLPMAVVQGTRGYYERIILQANGCYENRWFDACAVMVRRFVETLIIEVYEKAGRADEIKRLDDNFLMLSGLVDHILADRVFNLSRETKAGLPLSKALGDRSAHNRRYMATKADIDRVLTTFRVMADELLHLAGFRT